MAPAVALHKSIADRDTHESMGFHEGSARESDEKVETGIVHFHYRYRYLHYRFLLLQPILLYHSLNYLNHPIAWIPGLV
jgi:hypothetical protein